MIFNNISITNFGLYKGNYFIQLNPSASEGKHITIISGQNGVGKSTLQEAIHLCLLGPLSVDNRISESNYERYLLSRSYKHQKIKSQQSSLELSFDFTKSGVPVAYRVSRNWTNNPDNINEDVIIWENEIELKDLSKKEKNLFLRELIQPGFTKVMFFDGEKLSALYEENNLTAFVSESCKYLFGLNFVELLQNDLNYYVNKLHNQQDNTENSQEIKKIEEEISKIEKEFQFLTTENEKAEKAVREIKTKITDKEDAISKQGRWVTKKLYKLKSERQSLETVIKNSKKELIELYGSLGPFVFCKELCSNLKERLQTEREIEKWQHAKDLLTKKADELEQFLRNKNSIKNLGLDTKVAKSLTVSIKDILLAKPATFSDEETIFHEVSDTDRTKLVNWINEATNVIAKKIKSTSNAIIQSEEGLKVLNKEQSSFSKEDLVLPLIKELQELNKQFGAYELKIKSIQKRVDDVVKRKEFYQSKLQSLHNKLYQNENVDEKIKLSNKTKIVLEEYAQQLLTKKLHLLEQKVFDCFNRLCRKENYFDNLTIDPTSFEIALSKKGIHSEHKHLSAGEKQLLIIAFLWGLRELSNVALPLIIDTPLSRLDSDHRKTFIREFLPAIHPQVIMIGTDMEIMSDVFNELKPYIVRHYHLLYDKHERATQIEEGILTLNEAMAI